jgi:hypothetical protein
MSGNPAIHRRASGDVDIALPQEDTDTAVERADARPTSVDERSAVATAAGPARLERS